MSVDAQERVDPVRPRRSDDAMRIAEPAQNPRIGPRVVPIVIAILIGLAIVALLWYSPWG